MFFFDTETLRDGDKRRENQACFFSALISVSQRLCVEKMSL